MKKITYVFALTMLAFLVLAGSYQYRKDLNKIHGQATQMANETTDVIQKADELITRICENQRDEIRPFFKSNLVGVGTLDVCREYLSEADYQKFMRSVIDAGEKVGYKFLSEGPFSIIYEGEIYLSTAKSFGSEDPEHVYNFISGNFRNVTNIKFGCTVGLSGELVICY